MKKNFMITAILVVVISMFIGCALPIGIPGGTGGSGETAGHGEESSTEDVEQGTSTDDVAQDISSEDVEQGISTKDIAQNLRRMLVVPEDTKKVVDAAMDLFVGEDQWIYKFDLYLWDEKESLWAIHFNIDTSKELADEQFHKMAEILKELGHPQKDIHLDFGDREKKLELLLSSESTGSVEYVHVEYIPASSRVDIAMVFYPSGGKVGLDVDKVEKSSWSCVKDVANMLGINIKNLLESVSYSASYKEEGYNYIGLSITSFKELKDTEIKLYVEGYLGRSGIKNVVDKVEMVGDTYGGHYSMDDEGEDGMSVILKDARIDNSSFNVYFFTFAPPDKIIDITMEMECVVN